MSDYLSYRLAAVLSNAGSRRFAYWLSLRLADGYYVFDRQGRRAVEANLRHVLAYRGPAPSEEELRRLARCTFQHFGKYLVDFFRFSRLTEEDIRRLVEVENLGYLEEARQKGRGVVLATAHLGNWELGGAALAGLGYEMNAVALTMPSAKLNEFFQRYRQRRGIHILPFGGAARTLVRLLRANQMVGLLADRDFSGHNEVTNLFGAPAALPRGPAWLSEKTGAPLVPGFMLRTEKDTFRMRFHPPIYPEGRSQRDIQRALAAVLEDEISREPCQWFVFQPFWNEGGTKAPQ